MKQQNIFLSIMIGMILSSCVMKTKILDAGAISMSHTYLEEGKTLKEVGPVRGEFCADTFSDSGHVGLIDEAVKMTQKKSQVDMITDVSIYSNGRNCIEIEGVGQKIVVANSPDSTPVKKEK